MKKKVEKDLAQRPLVLPAHNGSLVLISLALLSHDGPLPTFLVRVARRVLRREASRPCRMFPHTKEIVLHVPCDDVP